MYYRVDSDDYREKTRAEKIKRGVLVVLGWAAFVAMIICAIVDK
jgi:hypothetical protein